MIPQPSSSFQNPTNTPQVTPQITPPVTHNILPTHQRSHDHVKVLYKVVNNKSVDSNATKLALCEEDVEMGDYE